jgi:hypothetical protein
MYQQGKNKVLMQLAGLGLGFWLLWLYPACASETGILRWHADMHWFDRLVGYTFMAIGPALAGFILGVRFGGQKVLGNCEDCGCKYDVDTSPPVSLLPGRTHWRCQSCRERYDRWDDWRGTQADPYSSRNEEERKWARESWNSDPRNW